VEFDYFSVEDEDLVVGLRGSLMVKDVPCLS